MLNPQEQEFLLNGKKSVVQRAIKYYARKMEKITLK